ncbi:hypothetical protein VIGAN_09142400 [Vigna angularis var. angularis]|uniref:DUF4378 domain-containing protein n=1 Tax=Vigna angularis var. angularis TaxID=157739 RepID=A0A0S3SYN0_PHAAN|nr:hypothetical protein VIGAN_09142400 [Vigna angularis var. angularis]
MSTQVQQLRRFNSMERRPRMLKDFLSDNLNSCSSSGFKSLPRKPTSMHTLIEMELKSSSSPPSNSPFQTLMNTIRSISFFTSVRKSPSVLSLPRSLSRKLSSSRRRTTTRSRSQGCNDISITTVKIKDIMRWKSFRDIVEPPPPPLDFMVDPTATTTTATWSISTGSSWSESDFLTSSREDPQNDSVEAGKKFSFSPLVVGKDPIATEALTCQEEQNSPVSVLQVGEDEFSPFDQSLANIQRRKQKFIETVQKLESLAKLDLVDLDQCLSLDENSLYDEEYEEDDDDDDDDIGEEGWSEKKAEQLLHCVKARCSADGCKDHLDTLLLDFFSEELSGNRKQYNEEELKTFRIAEDWINGSFAFDAGLADKQAYIKDMEKRDQWNMFKEEQEKLAFEIEKAIFHSLVADLVDSEG